MKKNIYIPIEIKNRELFGHLVIANEALKNDYRIILGNKSLIYKIIDAKKTKGGFLLYKGGGRSPDLISGLSKKLDVICVLDQELGVAVRERDITDWFKRRYFPSIIKYIDRFYLLGEKFYDAANNHSNIPKDKLLVTGWPRVDVWRNKSLWSDKAKQLKARYGKFILYSSDFGTNTLFQVEERAKRAIKWTYIKENSHYRRAYKRYENRYNEFLKMVDHLKQISSLDNTPHIIVRPHYAEDFDAWHNALNGLKNITVINEGSISSWLLASEGLLHSGCTTAFEAQLMNIKTAYLLDTAQSAVGSYPITISECLKNTNDYLRWTKKTVNEEVYPIDKYVIDIDHISSAKKIINDIELKDINAEPTPIKPHISIYIKFGRLMPVFLKGYYSKLMFIIKNPGLRTLIDYKQKMDGGITVEECKDFMKKLDFTSNDISYNKLEKDLIVIEKSR